MHTCQKSASYSTSFPGFFLVNWGGTGKDPGIGWSREQQTPENLGMGNKLVVTRLCIIMISIGALPSAKLTPVIQAASWLKFCAILS